MEDLTSQLAEVEQQKNWILVKEEEDPFKRLPDEIIVSHIFDKICEAKYLCFCSLVSKHFSSLVYQTHIVSFKIPHQDPSQQQLINNATTHSHSFPTKLFHFVTTPLRLVHWLFRSILPRSRGHSIRPFDFHFVAHVTAKFLTKFTSLKSLSIEFDHSGDLEETDDSGLVVKWKIDSKSSSFIMLTARSLALATSSTTTTTDDDINYDEDNNNINPREIELLGKYFDCNMGIADKWLTVLEMLVPILPESLQSVVMTDSKKEGKIDLGGIDLLQMRNGNMYIWNGEANIRFWHEPFLGLPLSGCVMKLVTLFLCKDNNESGYDDFLIAKEAFDGEENRVYGEAIMEMLKKDVASQEILRTQDFFMQSD